MKYGAACENQTHNQRSANLSLQPLHHVRCSQGVSIDDIWKPWSKRFFLKSSSCKRFHVNEFHVHYSHEYGSSVFKTRVQFFKTRVQFFSIYKNRLYILIQMDISSNRWGLKYTDSIPCWGISITPLQKKKKGEFQI